jgi:translation initiation factor IF-1
LSSGVVVLAITNKKKRDWIKKNESIIVTFEKWELLDGRISSRQYSF